MPSSHVPHRRVTVVALLAAALVASVTPSLAATPAAPSLRLFAASSTVTADRFGEGEPVYFDPGVYLTPVGGAFEVDVRRLNYSHPIEAAQVVRDGSSVSSIPLPSALGIGWDGLPRFLHVDVTRNAGGYHKIRHLTWCPNDFEPQRIDPDSVADTRFPQFCGGNPFSLGTVFGIDDGWAVNAFSQSGGIVIRGPDGRYTVTITIPPAFRRAFGISDANASVSITVKVKTVDDSGCPPFCGERNAQPAAGQPTDVPIMTDPLPSTLPDLQALPAWGMGVEIDDVTGDDFLTFGATVWNHGPAPLTVEGFRRPGTNIMDAYQYFYRDGVAIGRAKAGTMVYDARPGHEHWHFTQFATYTLLDATKSTIVRSEKEAFCLAPTDAIDLAAPGAIWRPDDIGLHTICGGQTSLWVRETLPSGWGDTYFQFLPGQSFDISGLPNGTYFIQVTANPTTRLFETNTANNSRLRRVILKGTPGHRRVVVPPWNGIDTG
jgi:hypothetical protein